MNLNTAAIVIGALIFGSGLVLAFGWPVLLLLAGAVLILWGAATQ